MKTREELIAFCRTFPEAAADAPFHDDNWTLMRCRNGHAFAFLFERDGVLWVNLKCSPEWVRFWQQQYSAVVPAYHMNKEHWISVILDGSLPEQELRRLIEESYLLVQPTPKKRHPASRT